MDCLSCFGVGHSTTTWTKCYPILTPSSPQVNNCEHYIIQGPSWQTGFFELAMTDRNMQSRYFLKMVLKFWDLRNFASTTSFHEMHIVLHLQSNLQTCKLFYGKNILNVTTVNLFSKIKIQCFFGVFDANLFQSLIKGKYVSISWFVTCYWLKIARKIHIDWKFTKELEIFENWTLDGTQNAFHENWLY